MLTVLSKVCALLQVFDHMLAAAASTTALQPRACNSTALGYTHGGDVVPADTNNAFLLSTIELEPSAQAIVVRLSGASSLRVRQVTLWDHVDSPGSLPIIQLQLTDGDPGQEGLGYAPHVQE